MLVEFYKSPISILFSGIFSGWSVSHSCGEIWQIAGIHWSCCQVKSTEQRCNSFRFC